MSSNKNKIDEQLYEIEEILFRKIKKSKIYYNVKWVNYDSSQNTWEPKENLPYEMVNEFEDNYKKKKNEKLLSIKRKKIEENLLASKRKIAKNQIDKISSIERKKKNIKKKIKVEKHIQIAQVFEQVDIGCFDNDSIESIVDLKVYKGKVVVGEVEWKKRLNGTKPRNSFYLYTVLYDNHPKLILDLIIKNKMIIQDKEEDLIDIPKEVRTKYQ